MSKGFPVSV